MPAVATSAAVKVGVRVAASKRGRTVVVAVVLVLVLGPVLGLMLLLTLLVPADPPDRVTLREDLLTVVPAQDIPWVIKAGGLCTSIDARAVAAMITATPQHREGKREVWPLKSAAMELHDVTGDAWHKWATDADGNGHITEDDDADAILTIGAVACAMGDELDDAFADHLPITQLDAIYTATLLMGGSEGSGESLVPGDPWQWPGDVTYFNQALVKVNWSRPSAVGDPPPLSDPGGGPPVSTDGTYRLNESGSGHLLVSELCPVLSSSTFLLRCDAGSALDALNTAYQAQFGRSMQLSSAYRSYAAQVSVRKSWCARGDCGKAATPGTSNHGWGLAADFTSTTYGGSESSDEQTWLLRAGPVYGWQHPSWARPGAANPEAWHWEWVGSPQGAQL